MYILNIFLFWLLIIWLYINSFVIKEQKRSHLFSVGFAIACFLIFCSLVTLQDIYTWYLLFELFNILVYILLLYYANQILNYKAIALYYVLRFLSSLLFLLRAFNVFFNPVSSMLILSSIVIKLRVFPFAGILANIYRWSNLPSFVFLSFVANFSYVFMLYILAETLFFSDYTNAVSYMIAAFSVTTLLQVSYCINKQSDVKSFLSYSSAANLPIFLAIFIGVSEKNLYKPYLTLIDRLAEEIYFQSIASIFIYIFLYLVNFVILTTFSYYINPPKHKSYLKNKTYFTSISIILKENRTDLKSLVAVLWIFGRFPPSAIFLLKYQTLSSLVHIDEFLNFGLIYFMLNTVVLVAYIRVIARLLVTLDY